MQSSVYNNIVRWMNHLMGKQTARPMSHTRPVPTLIKIDFAVFLDLHLQPGIYSEPK